MVVSSPTLPLLLLVSALVGKAECTHLLSMDSVHSAYTGSYDPPIDPKAAQLQNNIINAIASQSDFTIPLGEYSFGKVPLLIDGAVDLSISCEPGTTLWFGVGGGVQIENAVGLTFMGCTIDYTATLAQGLVVDYSSDKEAGPYFIADFDTRFLSPDPNTEPFMLEGGTVKIAFFDAATGYMIRNASVPAAINLFVKSVSNVTATHANAATATAAKTTRRYKVAITGNLAALPTALASNTPVAVFPRGGRHSLVVMNSTRVKVHRINIFGGSSMGIVDSNGPGGNAYTQINMTKRPAAWASNAERYLAVNADGFHSTTNDVGPTIDESQISFTGDDLGNICCAMSVLLSSTPRADGKPGNDVLFVDVGGNMLAYGKEGDTVAFYNISNTDGFGSMVLASAPALASDPASIQLMRAAYAKITGPPYNVNFVKEVQHHFMVGSPVKASLSPSTAIKNGIKDGRKRNAAVNSYTGSAPDSNVMADAAVVAARGAASLNGYPAPQPLWSIAILESTDNGGATVTRSSFHDGYARAFMVKGRDALYDGSDWARSGGIHIGPEVNWLEGDPGLSNVTVSNNRLAALGRPAIQVDDTVKSGGIVLVNNTAGRRTGV